MSPEKENSPKREKSGMGEIVSDLADHPILTREEEFEIFQTIEKGKIAQEHISSGKNSTDINLLKEKVQLGNGAREKLIRHNVRLLISIASDYEHQGVPLEDLLQEGFIGMIRAIEKFDIERGFKFSTYATWWIKQAVLRSVQNDGNDIRLPVHKQIEASRMKKAKRKLAQKLGREPNQKEVSEEAGLDIDRIKLLTKFSAETLSLDREFAGESDDLSLLSLIEDKDVVKPPEFYEELARKEQVERLLGAIPKREAHILKLRFGIDTNNPMTLQEIAEELGVTRERIRQIESKALRRIKVIQKKSGENII